MVFAQIGDLESWLRANGVDTAGWGARRAKTLADLWQEYTRGEIGFSDDPPLRLVYVVRILLRRGERTLLELAQEFRDGRLRRRDLPPSEKIIGSETPARAARRCLAEELGLVPQQIDAFHVRQEKRVTFADSPSYPGLRTLYTIYTVEVSAAGLPDEDFWRENEAARAGDPVRRHLWGWR